jgi:hypothetical protein
MNNWHWIIVSPLASVNQSVDRGSHRFGEEAPARQLRRQDKVIFYSAVMDSINRNKCQMFTASGEVADDEVETHITDEGFVWFQRKISFFSCRPSPIHPLLKQLSFIHDLRHWGWPFKSRQFEISAEDYQVIVQSMSFERKNTLG